MEFNQRENREVRRPSEGGPRINRQPLPDAGEEKVTEKSFDADSVRAAKKSSKGPWILLLTLIVVVAILGYVFRDKLPFTKGLTNGGAFQAVFLTNGQVYFGKLSEAGSRYAKLENIYYLQVTPVLQTKTEGQPGSQANQQQQLSLVKLGNELHGPIDEMHINRDQILFVEDLKEDSRVVQAIKDYETAEKK